MNELVKVDPKLITVFENIKKSIIEIDDLKDLKALRDTANGFESAWQAHYRSSGFGLEQMFLGWETKVRSERRMGEMLKGMELDRGGRPDSDGNRLHDETSLDDLGISKTQSHRYQQLGKIEEDKFDKKIEELRLSFIEPTTKALMNIGAHVGHNSGEFEWYTPPTYIEAARFVMGKIDLDPASSETANEIVKAKKFYTAEDDGLQMGWFGNVWMNPPYSQPLVELFTDKLVSEYKSKNISQACVLVNNATETVCGQKLLESCTCVCFPKGRIKFLTKDKEERMETNPLQGQMLIYFGGSGELFEKTFSNFGQVLWQEEKSKTERDLDR